MFVTNNHDSFGFWWNENFIKHEKVSKYYGQDCGCSYHSSSANERDKSKFIKPGYSEFYWVRYEFQCEKGGATIKVLPAMCKNNDLEKHLIIFLSYVSNDQYIYIYAKCNW